MPSIKQRIFCLERKARSMKPTYPVVVYFAENETDEEARKRALNRTTPPQHWPHILCPMPLSEEEWVLKYPPE